MDGVLADFNAKFSEEKRHKMFEPGFFLELEPLFNKEDLQKSLEKLRSRGYVVNILSKAVDTSFCRKEKLDWLSRHAPWFDDIIILNSDENKGIVLNDEPGILFDDYTENLIQWERAGGKGVKVGGRMKDNFPYIKNISELLEVLL